jgi:hypothetical protein
MNFKNRSEPITYNGRSVKNITSIGSSFEPAIDLNPKKIEQEHEG